MANSHQQVFGTVAQAALNYFNPPGNNHGSVNYGSYGQLPPQGSTAYSPQTPQQPYHGSPQPYHSNEPTPLLPQKPGFNTNYNYAPPQDPSQNPNYNPNHLRNDRVAVHRFTKFRRYMKITLLISKCLSALLSALMQGIMMYMMIKFQQTRHIPGGGRSGPWSKDTKLWPTIMLAVSAGLTLLLTLWSLVAMACRRGKSSKKAAKSRRCATIIKYAVHIGFWAGVTLFYRLGKTGQDLWGWSCSEKAAAIQDAFKSDLDFSKLCMLQTNSWGFSLAEFGGKCILSLVAFIFHRKGGSPGLDLTDNFGGMAVGQM